MMRNAILTLAAGGFAVLAAMPAKAADPTAILTNYADIAAAGYTD